MISRHTLKFAILGLLIALHAPLHSFAPGGPSTPSKVEKRLLGKWISDREKTIQHHKFKDGLSKEKRDKFESIFGKLKIEFTETEMRTEHEGNIEVGPYTVLDSDKDSVVLWVKDFEGQKLLQLHFENGRYYVLSGYMVEFFKRIPAQPQP